MKNRTLLWIGIYAAVAYGGYYLYFSKDRFAKQIKSLGKSAGTLETLKTFDLGFLRAWASAARKNEPNFTFKGKIYVTQGGKASK
jgi:hypothetical protein